MYAMDHTMHFEHRTTDPRSDDATCQTDQSDQRASRWDLRRLVSTQPADTDSNPVHGFLD